MILKIKGVPVKVELNYANRNSRTFHLCFGEISVTIRQDYSIKKLEEALNKCFTYEQVSKLEIAPFIDGDYAYILGDIERVYPKKYLNTIDDIYIRKNGRNISCKKYFLNILTDRVRYYEKIMNLEEHQVKIKTLKSILGSNNYRKKIIVFNDKLVHFDINLIDQVIVHELCHDFYQNHSKLFYQKVNEFCPNYQEKRNKLICGVRK